MSQLWETNTTQFYISDLSEQQWWENRDSAELRYKSGERPTWSTGICGSLTCGYGRLDEYGYWECPLYVNPETNQVELIND